MGVHELVTGLNGHGKSLYTVAEKLRPLVGTKISRELGAPVDVRLVVGGIRDLLLPHELMDVPELDAETYVDDWRHVERDPGRSPVGWVRMRKGGKVRAVTDGVRTRWVGDDLDDVAGWVACEAGDEGAQPLVCSILNWWAWCQPGDVITVDEAQRVFRPMASGKRVPMFVSKLETARHYGVRFVYITQHPQLLHANVRALVGPIEDVSRVFGGSRTLIRQWDRIGDYGKKAMATTRMWAHDKGAFGLYKSSELHTKFGSKLPIAVYLIPLALLALAGISWTLKDRLQERFGMVPAEVSQAKPPMSAASAPQGMRLEQRAPVASASGPVWPALAGRQGPAVAEPYEGRGIELEGELVAGASYAAWFGLWVKGQRVATVRLQDLTGAGYSWKRLGPCSGVLQFGELQRPVTCALPGQVPNAQTQGDREAAALDKLS